MGSAGMHRQLVRKLDDAFVKALLITFCVSKVRFLKSGREQMTVPYSRRARRKIQASQPCLSLWEGVGTTNPGNHFQMYKGQGGELMSLA